MAKGKKYTEAQKKAYYSGMGYAVCQEGKRIDFKSEENKDSFRAGLKKGKERSTKYPDRKGSNK